MEIEDQQYDAGLADGWENCKKEILNLIKESSCYYQLTNKEPLLDKKSLIYKIKKL